MQNSLIRTSKIGCSIISTLDKIDIHSSNISTTINKRCFKFVHTKTFSRITFCYVW